MLDRTWKSSLIRLKKHVYCRPVLGRFFSLRNSRIGRFHSSHLFNPAISKQELSHRAGKPADHQYEFHPTKSSGRHTHFFSPQIFLSIHLLPLSPEIHVARSLTKGFFSSGVVVLSVLPALGSLPWGRRKSSVSLFLFRGSFSEKCAR